MVSSSILTFILTFIHHLNIGKLTEFIFVCKGMFEGPFTHSGAMVRFRTGNKERVGYFDSDRPGILLDVAQKNRSQLTAEGIFKFLDYDEVFKNIHHVKFYKFEKRKVKGEEAEKIHKRILRVIENKDYDLIPTRKDGAMQTHGKRKRKSSLNYTKGKMHITKPK